MEYTLPILVICAALAVFLLFRKTQKKEPPREVYVCRVCGERDCICHKEEQP